MKTRTFNKDIRRSIAKSFGRFIAIVAIVALGAGFYAGLNAVAPDMRDTVDKYYDDTNMMDVRLLSTLGFSEEDVDVLRDTEGVSAVQPGYFVDVLSTIGDKQQAVRLHSLPEGAADGGDFLNRPVLVEGRYPEADDECLLGRSNLDVEGIALGTVIELDDSDGTLGDNLKVTRFTVVGIVESSYYLSFSLGSTDIGSGTITHYLYVPQDAFCTEVYTDIYLAVADAKALNTFSQAYDDKVKTVTDRLEETAGVREGVRYESVYLEAYNKIADAQKELDEQREKLDRELYNARKKLNDAQTQLDAGAAQLDAGAASVAQAQKELDAKSAQLDALEAQYQQGVAALEPYKTQYDTAYAAYAAQLAAWQTGMDAWQTARDALDAQPAPHDPDAEAALTQRKAVLDATKAALDDSYNNTLAPWKAQLDEQSAPLAELRASLDAGRAQITAAQAKIDDSSGQIAAGRASIESSRAALADGWNDYYAQKADAEQQLADAEDKLTEARQKLSDIEEAKWYVLTRDENVGFASFKSDADRMAALGTVFPVLFFLVAALVALTTMTRMVEEERVLIGTYKALGYDSAKIMKRYVDYALFATVAGAAAGVAVGFVTLPVVCWNSYRLLYTAPDVLLPYRVGLAAQGLCASLVCTLGATWSACRTALAEYPSTLMLPKAPKPGKRILLERIGFIWNRLSFIGKVTCRNLFRYKKRLVMTVVGIAGCTGLMLTGFGIKDSVSGILHNQYDELYSYNTVASVDAPDGMSERAKAVLEDKTVFSDYLLAREKSIDLQKTGSGGEKTVYLFVPEDAGRLEDFILLRSRTTKQAVALADDTAVLTEKAAKLLGVQPGDSVSFEIADGKTVDVVVGGITENYIYNYLYMSPQLYEKLAGEAPEYNMLMGKGLAQDETQRKALSDRMLDLPEFSTVTFTSEISAKFDDMIETLNYVVAVLIFCSAALAFVVLYNLTNINVTERTRELATLKVLGFHNRETAAYIYRETGILTLMGAVLGLGLGVIMHAFVIKTVEVDLVMFGRNIRPMSFLFSFALTLVFSVVVDIAMYGKLRRIDMVESLKSVD
ncbi:MAG: FtsX-like permease family protein [Oscillospiraceae bacterium]|nr:FtsX-like permease family protein [Oscillospiraceae bacterium]